ncbi:hypothetical protein BH20GEM2_BH20GEM2_17140 [soil metagenome]
MESSVATLPRPHRAAPTEVSTATTPWVLYAVLFSSTCIVVGLIWDISWHMTVGRDTLWTAPHVLEQIGASVAGLACGWLVLKTTFAGSAAERDRSVRFWGFRGPLGAWICIWGALAMIASVPFDNWWHNAYGLDVRIISPPHVVLIMGMMAIQLGAMMMALGAQNRADAERAERRFGLMYVYAAGIFVAMAAIFATQYINNANVMHGSMFYKVTAGVFPLLLLAVARGSKLRWPATITAAVYMGIFAVMIWILQLVPATPKLAPIYNPVTHMVPIAFPLLLVVPAFALDLLMHRFRGRRDWLLAAAAGVVFVAIMLAVHWFWAEFMLSPAARNYVFAADQWAYMSRLGPWQYEYWTLDLDAAGDWSPLLFARGMGIALVIGILSSRIGLAWGSWMRRVQR